jgi:WD40 repeat protein
MAYDRANRLATADDHGKAALWDLAARRQLRTMDAPRSRAESGSAGFAILTMAFSADGQTLATGSENGTLHLWQVATGREQPAIPAHSGWLRDAAYSPDGTRLATVGRDGTLILWGATTGVRLLTLNPLSGPLNSVAFAPGGRYIATAGEDGTLRVFTLDVKELEALARSRVTRGLEDRECKTFLHLSRCPAEK